MKPNTLPEAVQAEIKRFVESDAEVPKATLIHRIAGAVSRSAYQIIKSLQFHSVKKDRLGEVVIL